MSMPHLPSISSSSPTPSIPSSGKEPLPEISLLSSAYSPYDNSIHPASLSPLLQSLFEGKGEVYQAMAQHPLLSAPSTEKRSEHPACDPPVRGYILNQLDLTLRERLKAAGLSDDEIMGCVQELSTGKTITHPLGQKIVEETVTEVRLTYRLSPHWAPHLTSAEHWIASPPDPYSAVQQQEINGVYDKAIDQAFNAYLAAHPDLTEEDIGLIRQGLNGNATSSGLVSIVEEISRTAAEQVQQQYGLPPTWFRGTTAVDLWRPTGLEPLSPARVDLLRQTHMASQAKELVQSLQALIKQEDPNDEMGTGQYMAIMLEGLSKVLNILTEAQKLSSEALLKNATKRQEELNLVTQQTLEQLENSKKQNELEKKSWWWRIIGMVGSVVLAFVATLATGGMLSAIVVAAVTVVFVSLDQALGITPFLMGKLNDAMKALFPNSPVLQKVMKAVIMAIVIAVIVVATGVGGGLAVIGPAIKQIGIQLALMVFLASNVVPEMVGTALRALGVDESLSRTIEMVVVIATAFIAMLVAAGGVKQIGEGLKAAGRYLKEGGAALGRNSLHLLQRVLHACRHPFATASHFPAALKALMIKIGMAIAHFFKQLATGAVAAPGATWRGMKAIGGSIKDGCVAIKARIKLSGKGADQLTEEARRVLSAQAEKGMAAVTDIQKGIQLITLVTEAGGGITAGISGLRLAKLQEEHGEIEREILLLQGVIDMLDKLREQINRSAEHVGTTAEDLRNGFHRWMQQLEQRLSQTLRPLQG